MINAKVIADSKNELGNRITTMVVTMPRIILAEFNTHRMFSRNSASSRAIPFEKMVKSVEENPFISIAVQEDHKGMQGTKYFNEREYSEFKDRWILASREAIRNAKHLSSIGVTKQLCNRLLEPFMWHTVIVTATEWDNFFELRCPKYFYAIENGKEFYFRSKKDCLKSEEFVETYSSEQLESFDHISWLNINKGQAEIHIMQLAECMWDAMNESTPKELKAGEWHIPFGDQFDQDQLHEAYFPSNPDELETMNEEWKMLKIKIATARCARVSYTVVGEEGKESNYENDIKLHNRLLESKHASPTEHCAKAQNNTNRSRNFTGGWLQYREMLNI